MRTEEDGALLERAKALKLYGIVDGWDIFKNCHCIEEVIFFEEDERSKRSFKRRLESSKLKNFKSLPDIDWSWPRKCDRQLVESLMSTEFINEAINVLFFGPSGSGKTTMAKNIAYQSIVKGYTALFVTASEMLNDLTEQTNDESLTRRIKHYTKPDLLLIDEVGYLSYSNRHADLFFQIISTRYEKKSTMITTNKPFSEWAGLFPNASCVVSLIDRLVHKSEIINIDADSFRAKEAKERLAEKEKREATEIP